MRKITKRPIRSYLFNDYGPDPDQEYERIRYNREEAAERLINKKAIEIQNTSSIK